MVPYDAPLDRIKLVTIGGRPGIAQLAMPAYTHTLRVTVVERMPEKGQPGILLSVSDSARSLEEVEKTLEEMMSPN
jgi:hypothetical protein